MIKNTLANKSGNPESLKKMITAVGNLSTNVYIVDEEWLRTF